MSTSILFSATSSLCYILYYYCYRYIMILYRWSRAAVVDSECRCLS